MGLNQLKRINSILRKTSCGKNYNVADAFETLIILTNTDMIKSGKMNLGKKEEIKPFQLVNEDYYENNESLKQVMDK